MATYLIASEINLIRQEGDSADIVFTLPSAITYPDLDMSLFTEIKFLVKNASDIIISKTLTSGGISVNSQTITITLDPDDTVGKYGQSRWELEISNETPTVFTIGKGNMIINKQLIDNG